MKNTIIIFLVISAFFFMYRSCTKGYDRYGYFVHVTDEKVFEKQLSGSDKRIIEHSRRRIEKIVLLDQKLDNNNGPEKGVVRWYICSGIDCDERWEISFPAKKGKKDMNIDDFDKNKIKEYRQYKKKSVNLDVQKDIEKKSIKLFYIDIYEVPEILVISENTDNLPPHERIYIGSGCTDAFNSDDCSNEYRVAMESALFYGKEYNKGIAKHFNLQIKDDIQKDLNPTQKFIGQEESERNRIKIELDDIQPLFGGRHIWIDGGGNVFVQSVRPGKKGLEQKNYAFALEKDEMAHIVNVFIEQDFCSLKNTQKQGVPDQATPKIGFENFIGKVHSVWNWDPPVAGGDETLDQRFHTVYRAVLRLETKALETMEPVNHHPFNN